MNQQSLVDKINQYQARSPEEIFHWYDPSSAAEGMLVIDSWAYGACGGGTRITATLDADEVIALAKVMGLKFQLFGPQMGGAKSCLAIPANCSDKTGVLGRWFAAIAPFLRRGYGTAADLNTDFSMIAQQFQQLGYAHPQQGIWQALGMNQKQCQQTAEQMRVLHVPMKIGPRHVPLAELVTGYGIAQSVYAAYLAREEDLTTKRAMVQGIGTVGAAAAYYLHQLGVQVVGLADESGGVLRKDGFDEVALIDVLTTHQLPMQANKVLTHHDFYQRLSEENVAIIVPAACAYLNDASLVNQWVQQGLEVMACGANLPFKDVALYGPLAQKLDQLITLIPSCVASGGMARAFSSIMQNSSSRLFATKVLQDIKASVFEVIQPATERFHGYRVAEQCYAGALKEFHPEKSS